MELNHDFRVSVPLEEAWSVMTDLERIAPSMPGAQLLEVDGDEYRGVVKVKVGPITVQYSGVAQMLERDDVAHRAVLRAEGRETRGQGNASATITATLSEDNGGTAVSILTDLAITGKVAQFGRGLIADVSSKLLDQFVTQLEANVLSGESESSKPASPSSSDGGSSTPSPSPVADEATVADDADPDAEAVIAPSSTARTVASDPVAPVDLFATAGSSMAKRVVPGVIVLAGIGAIIWWITR